MKHPEKVRQVTSDIFGVGSEFFHGFGRCFKHGSIGNTLVAADEASQMLRHREGNHEVVPRQLALHLPFHPQFDFMVLALRTMTVAAGPERHVLNTTVGAFINNHAAGLGPTFHDGINDFFMLIGHGCAKGFNILWAVGAKNLIYSVHGQILS